MNNDCLECIFYYLPVSELCTVSSICKQYNKIADNSTIWKSVFSADFNQIAIYDNHKEKYKQFTCLNKFIMVTGYSYVNNGQLIVGKFNINNIYRYGELRFDDLNLK